mgnify:CR=1 FL=1
MKLKLKLMVILIYIILMSNITLVSASEENDGPIISNTTIWKDQNKIFSNNVIVYPNSCLVLENTKLTFACNETSIYGIIIKKGNETTKGGKLIIKDGSNITAQNVSYNTYICSEYSYPVSSKTPIIQAKDSYFSELGYSIAGKKGLEMQTTSNDSYFDNVTITNSYAGIVLSDGGETININNSTFNNIESYAIFSKYAGALIYNNEIKNMRFGVYAQYTNGLEIINNTFDCGTKKSGSYVIDIMGNPTLWERTDRNFLIENNKLKDFQRGIILNVGVRDGIIKNNIFENASGVAVGINKNIHNISIFGNSITDVQDGIIAQGDNMNIYDNIIVNPINPTGYTAGLRIEDLHDSLITNITIGNTDQRTSKGVIMKNSTNLTLKNLVLTNFATSIELTNNSNIQFENINISKSIYYDIDFDGSNNNIRWINTRYGSNKIHFNDNYDVFLPYYLLVASVKDNSNNQVENAKVEIKNEIDNITYPSLNIGGEKKDKFSTNVNGNTSNPLENGNNTIVILDYCQDRNNKTEMNYTISIQKDIYSTNLTEINPNETWYCLEPDKSIKTITAVLPVNLDSNPTSSAGADCVAYISDKLTFDGSASTDDNSIVSYEWDFDATNGFQSEAFGAIVTYTYETAGTYTVTLRVTDADGNKDCDICKVTVLEKNNNTIKSNAFIELSPSSNNIIPGKTFTVNVLVDPSMPIIGTQLDFEFNSSMGSANSVIEGDLFKQKGASTFFNEGDINSSEGKIKHIYGLIIGTSNVSSPGTFATVNLTAGNRTGMAEFSLSNVLISDINSKSVPYTVTNATVLIDTAPAIDPICCPKSVDEKSNLAFKISAKDADGDRLTLSASGLPEGSSFNRTSGAFAWTPAVGQAGVYTITFKVSDGYLTDFENVTVTVNKLNNPPVINFFEPINGSSFSEGERIGISVNATDAEKQALNYSIKIDGVMYSSDPAYIWETDYSSSGNHTIEVSVSDGIDEAKMQHSIYISECHPRYDVNEDGVVNILDITNVSREYETTVSKPYPRYDTNQDGEINILDLTLVGHHFGEKVE